MRDVRLTNSELGVGSFFGVTLSRIAGALCAVKKMHESLFNHEGGGRKRVDMFLYECRIMSSLRHPNIVQFLGLVVMPQSRIPVPGLVMEFMPHDLGTLLEDIPNIPLSFKHSFLSDVANGLSYLHSESVSIIHGDLNARNILLTSGMVAKIGDFGSSQLVQRTKDRLECPGTSVYMPPECFEQSECLEQNDSLDYSLPLDIFSFGVLALFTLTQCFPADIKSQVYRDSFGKLIARSEIDRRVEYIRKLYEQFERKHPLVLIVTRSLQNKPASCPTIDVVISMLDSVRSSCYDEEIEANKLQLYLRTKESSEEISSLQLQIDDLKIVNAQLVSDTSGSLQILVQEKEDEMRHCQESLDGLRSRLAVTKKLGNATGKHPSFLNNYYLYVMISSMLIKCKVVVFVAISTIMYVWMYMLAC